MEWGPPQAIPFDSEDGGGRGISFPIGKPPGGGGRGGGGGGGQHGPGNWPPGHNNYPPGWSPRGVPPGAVPGDVYPPWPGPGPEPNGYPEGDAIPPELFPVSVEPKPVTSPPGFTPFVLPGPVGGGFGGGRGWGGRGVPARGNVGNVWHPFGPMKQPAPR